MDPVCPKQQVMQGTAGVGDVTMLIVAGTCILFPYAC
jgi:hypothetical protein